MKWQASQYLKFEKERTLPAKDLTTRLAGFTFETIVDLGCGPGNSTATIANLFPKSQVTGFDSSREMIAAAKSTYPDFLFEQVDLTADLRAYNNQFDLIFSNACFQWVPDHQTLFPRLKEMLTPKGVIAAQIPMNHDEPIQQLIKDVVSRQAWAPYFKQSRQRHELTPLAYVDLLKPLFSDVTFWTTTYLHQLDSHEAILDWYKGTGLLPYLAQLDSHQTTQFLAEILAEIQLAYPLQADGGVIFPFPRFFMVLEK